MTKDEIVKALWACGRGCCDDCVCFKNELSCKEKNLGAADLIEQQAARIVELEAKVAKDGGNSMKKLFISQPMRGKTDGEILAARAAAVEAAQRLLCEEVYVIDSFMKDAPTGARPLWYLGESLKLLAVADVAYFAEGWAEARGCRIEYDCAIAYGIPTISDGSLI